MAINLGRQRAGALTLKNAEMHGTVVDNNDPDKSERVKIRIKGVHDKVSDADLPWVHVPRGGQASGKGGTGSVSVLDTGTNVVMKYEDSSMYHGRVSSVSPQKAKRTDELAAEDETGKAYPHVDASIDSAGTRTTINKKTGNIDIEHASGSTFSIDGKGNLSVRTANKKADDKHTDKHSPGMNIHVSGNANILADGNVSVGGKANVTVIAEGDLTLAAKGNVKIVANGNVLIEGAEVHSNLGGLSVPALPSVTPQPSRPVPKPDVPKDPTKG